MRNSEFKWSKYTHVVDKLQDGADYVCLFHILTMETAYLTKKIYESINKQIEGEADPESADYMKELTELGFVVDSELCEGKSFEDIRAKLSRPDPTTLRLLITDACNLNCTYCQIEKNMAVQPQLHMDSELALKAMRVFARLSPKEKQKTVILTGGEPLVNMEVVKTVVDNGSSILDNYRVVVFTNGTLITREIAEYFKSRDVFVLISMDGPEEIHNKVRRSFDGTGSFAASYRGYEICRLAGCKVGISGVIGSHNADALEDEVLDFFIGTGCLSVGLNYPHYLLNVENPELIPMEEYSEKIIAAHKKARESGLFLENISRVIMPFVSKKIRGKECAALGKGITVTPSGKVGPCKTLLVADIVSDSIDSLLDAGTICDIDAFAVWVKRSTFSLECCRDCFAVSLCGTGCTYDSYVVNSNIEGIDPRSCVFSKAIFSFLINELFSIVRAKGASGFIVPSDSDREEILKKVQLKKDDIKRSAGHDLLLP